MDAQPKIDRRLPGPDILRGLTVGLMLLVNHPAAHGHTFRALRHAEWNGLLGADVVFPLFLFVVGFSVALASRSAVRTSGKGATGRRAVLLRSAVLLLLGLGLNAIPYPGWETLRFPGVLPRIAIVYLVCSWMASRSWSAVSAVAVLLAVAQSVVYSLGVPGVVPGGWEPGANPAGWLDRIVFGTHVWRYSPDGDPEGVLSTLGALATGLAGLAAGLGRDFLRKRPGLTAFLAVACALLGVLVAVWIPINKHLWTASFVLLTAGLAFALLALAELVAERPQARAATQPLLALGENALPVYIGAIALERVLRALPWGAATGAAAGGAERSVHGMLTAPFLGAFADPRLGSLAWAGCWAVAWTILVVVVRARGFRLRIPGV